MIIQDLAIQGVGRFSQAVKFTFQSGYNVVLGSNESGKTTFSKAVMAVFFPEVYANTPDFINWQLEGNSRSYITIKEENELYRLVRDFSNNLSNLSRYVPEKKAFFMVSKDDVEIRDFLKDRFKLFDQEIYSSVFYADFNSLPSTNPFGIIGSAPRAIPSTSKTKETDDEFEGMDPVKLKEKHEILIKEIERSKELDKLQSSMDEEQSNLFDLQSEIKEIREIEAKIRDLSEYIERFKMLGESQAIMGRIDKFFDSEKRMENTIGELRSKKGQAEAELMNAKLPSLKDNKYLLTGLGIAIAGIVITYVLKEFLITYIPEKFLSFGNLAVIAGFLVAGWGFWQFIQAQGYISRLRKTVSESDEQIRYVKSRYESESREIKELMKSLGADNIDTLKKRVSGFKQSEINKKALEEKLKVLMETKDYEKLEGEEEKIEKTIEELLKKQDEIGSLGFTPQEMKEEIKRIEDHLAKRGIPVKKRFDESKALSSGSGGSWGGMVSSRFPDDHIARFLAIATELLQKGQIDPLGELQNLFNKYIQILTKKNYSRATFSKGGVIKFFKADNLMRVGLDSMTPATKDSIYFALKFSLIESILKRRSLPIILDDPFMLFDDSRLESVSAILKELSKKGQIIYLTSRQSALKGADRSFRIK